MLKKATLVLCAFSVEQTTLTFTQLRKRTGLAKATLHRLLGDLVEVNLIDRIDAQYRLSGLVFELGMRASVERDLFEVAIPFMEDLYERTHETVQLGVRHGLEVVYVSKIGGHRQAQSKSRIGGRMPLHATAIGKVLLAHSPPAVRAEMLKAPLERIGPRTITAPGLLRRQLDGVAEHGVAYEFEESSPGIVCVAAPILDEQRLALAAVSVTGPISTFRPDQHVSSVKAAAAGIGAVVAHRILRQ